MANSKILTAEQERALRPVSYTHLDVYKRQALSHAGHTNDNPECNHKSGKLSGQHYGRTAWYRADVGSSNRKPDHILSLIHI